MASKRRLRRKSCEGKVKFPDHASAVQACYSYKRKFNQYMRAYPCHFCSGYHIGHPPKRIIQGMLAARGG